jgi:hypothetical protein
LGADLEIRLLGLSIAPGRLAACWVHDRVRLGQVYALPESLDELVGPTTGAMTLPRHIDWGPHYVYDLTDEADLLLMYERVIREAQAPADLRTHLNATLLRRHWTDLFLPSPTRMAWQARFPEDFGSGRRAGRSAGRRTADGGPDGTTGPRALRSVVFLAG